MNIPKFKGMLAEKNISVNDLKSLLNCTRQTASRKVNGKTPISLVEAQFISEYAHLTDAEKIAIFLSDE